MSLIKSIYIENFKKFKSDKFEFNDDINILVGNNNAGKSTILEALELVLNLIYRGKSLNQELFSELFEKSSVDAYLKSDKASKNLPKILLEAYVDGVPEYRGLENKHSVDTQGISLKVAFDEELEDAYQKFIIQHKNMNTIPVEFYKIEWFDFAWSPIKNVTKKIICQSIDTTRIHPTYGKNRYLSRIISTTLSKDEQATLLAGYRQLKQSFNEDHQVKEINKQLDIDNSITEKTLSIATDTLVSNFEDNLQLAVDDIYFPHVGKGEQNKIQIKLAIQNKSGTTDVILLEEPENHLSHTNLSQLIRYINDKRNNKQIFLTTHSSYVLNKLSFDKLCLINNGYKLFKDLNGDVSKSIKRLPGYDTLRIVLAEKVILVEGPSDELILKRRYLDVHGKLPEDDAIDIIVVRGLGFKNYLEIAALVGTKVNVMTDNDSDFEANIQPLIDTYSPHKNIKFLVEKDNNLYSLEPILISENYKTDKAFDNFLKIAFSTVTTNAVAKITNKDDKIKYLHDFYSNKKGGGKKKVDSAIRIFDSKQKIEYPKLIDEAFNFD